MFELHALLGWNRVWKPKRIKRKSYDDTQNVCSLKHDLKICFWRKSSLIERNHTFILVRGTRAKFYVRQFRAIEFPLQGKKALVEYLLDKPLVTSENLSTDILIDRTKSQVLLESKDFPGKTSLHIPEENFS